MSRRHLLLLSNSTLHPTGYLEYAKETIIQFLKENQVQKVSHFSNAKILYFFHEKVNFDSRTILHFSNFLGIVHSIRLNRSRRIC